MLILFPTFPTVLLTLKQLKPFMQLKSLTMNKLAILIFSPITILSAPKSPELGDNNLTFLNKFNSNTTIMPVFDLRYDGIKGSKFFYNEYMDGEIWMSNNRHFTTEYKFDEEKNTIQVQLKEGKEAYEA